MHCGINTGLIPLKCGLTVSTGKMSAPHFELLDAKPPNVSLGSSMHNETSPKPFSTSLLCHRSKIIGQKVSAIYYTLNVIYKPRAEFLASCYYVRL